MKKIAGKIAMILVLVMLANNFMGCASILDGMGNAVGEILGGLLVVGILVLIAVLVVEAPDETETGIYLASVGDNSLTDYYSAMEILNSLPETERAALLEKTNSLPEAKRTDLVRTVSSLPPTEITASIERLNALSEAELVSAVRDFNALSETELDVWAEKLNERTRSLPKADYVALVAVSP